MVKYMCYQKQKTTFKNQKSLNMTRAILINEPLFALKFQR